MTGNYWNLGSTQQPQLPFLSKWAADSKRKDGFADNKSLLKITKFDFQKLLASLKKVCFGLQYTEQISNPLYFSDIVALHLM